MKTINFDDFERMVIEDFEDLQLRQYKSFHDEFLGRLFVGDGEGFIEEGLKVTYSSATQVSITAGRGYMTDTTVIGQEPVIKPLDLVANISKTVSAAHATLNRIDIVVATVLEETEYSENRDIKTGGTGPIVTTFTAKGKYYTGIFNVVGGTPNASPVAPSVPAGYVKLAELFVTAAVGLAGASAVTDYRRTYSWKRNTVNTVRHDKQIGSGMTHTHPFLDIPAGVTYSGAGNLFCPGGITGAGNLLITGTVIS